MTPPGRRERLAVAAVTGLGLLLRLHHAGSDLWMDELVGKGLARARGFKWERTAEETLRVLVEATR